MRADRLLAMLLTIQVRGKVTAADLAKRLEVSERTIYRDIDALSAAGVPIYAERGPGGGVALLEGYRTELTGLNQDEVRALSLLSVKGTMLDLGVSQALESALLKLSAALPQIYRHSIEQVRERIYMDTARWFSSRGEAPFLPMLQEAVWNGERLDMVYRKDSGQVKTYLLEPYGIVAKLDIWYVIGKTAAGLRVFRVDRVQDLRSTGDSFERDEAFRLLSFWQDWVHTFETSRPVYPVTLRVAPALLDTMCSWLGEAAQEAARAARPDSEGWRQVAVSFEHLSHAAHTLASLGSGVEVLAPAELRAHMTEMARGMLELYSPNA